MIRYRYATDADIPHPYMREPDLALGVFSPACVLLETKSLRSVALDLHLTLTQLRLAVALLADMHPSCNIWSIPGMEFSKEVMSVSRSSLSDLHGRPGRLAKGTSDRIRLSRVSS